MLYCLSNYYGDDCGTYCSPIDDETDGHYTCDPETGDKECMAGNYIYDVVMETSILGIKWLDANINLCLSL